MSSDSTRIPTGTLQWPLPVAGTITSQFGHRVDPITGEVSSHTGTDIACAEGTPILAAADGVVTVANGLDSWGGSYGYYIQIDHGGGLETLYAHCSSILHDIQTGESAKPNLQEQLEQTQQEFDRLLEMSLDFDEDTPFLDDRLKKLNSKIKRLRKAIGDTAAQQEKASQPEMLLSAKDLQIQEYDDALTARIIEKITVRSRNEIEIQFTGDYKKSVTLR